MRNIISFLIELFKYNHNFMKFIRDYLFHFDLYGIMLTMKEIGSGFFFLGNKPKKYFFFRIIIFLPFIYLKYKV